MAMSNIKLLKKICEKERSLELLYMETILKNACKKDFIKYFTTHIMIGQERQLSPMQLYGVVKSLTVCRYDLTMTVANQSLMLPI